MPEIKLRSCPHCGGDAIVGTKTFDVFNVGAYVFCNKCGARTAIYHSRTGLYRESEKMAADAWNKRAED